MPNATVAINRLQTLQIALDFATQIALDLDLVIRDRMNDLVQLLRGEILRTQIWIDIGLLENASGCGKTDSIDVGQGRFDALVCRNFDS